MLLRAIKYKGEIYTDRDWHVDAINRARRWLKEELDESLIEFGYIDENYNWIEDTNDNWKSS